MYLTRRQREIFDFIRAFIEEKSYSPSLEEIARGMELSSLATVHKHLKHLAEKGIIKRHWNRGRGIELVSDLDSPNIVQMELDAAYKLPSRASLRRASRSKPSRKIPIASTSRPISSGTPKPATCCAFGATP